MQMQIVTRDITEYAAAPPQQPGTATILAGTGDVAMPIAKIQEFAHLPGAPPELKEFAEGLLEALEEQIDFKLAAERRNEPITATWDEMRKKHGL